jgi:hypothetical protein
MLIGLRILLLLAILAAGISFLAYVFTKNPAYIRYARNIIKVTLAFAALIAVIYLAERLLLL